MLENRVHTLHNSYQAKIYKIICTLIIGMIKFNQI